MATLMEALGQLDDDERKKLEASKVIDNEDGTATVLFDVPVQTEKGEVAEATARAPTVGQIEAADRRGGNDMAQSIFLLAECTGLPMTVIRKMALRDYNRVQNAIGALTAGKSPAIGGTSSEA
jgi:hypothetical protein